MNVNGFRYCIEIPKGPGSGWKPILSGDDRALLERLYYDTVAANKQRPHRMRDRSTDKVLHFHAGSLG